jgi:hypothetical protein
MSQSSLSGERCVSLLIAPQYSRCLDLLESFGSTTLIKVVLIPATNCLMACRNPRRCSHKKGVLVAQLFLGAARHEYRCGSLLRLSRQRNEPSTRCYFIGEKRKNRLLRAADVCADEKSSARSVPRLECLYDVVAPVRSTLGKLPAHVCDCATELEL